MAGAWSKQCFGTPVPKVFASTDSSTEICSPFLRTAVLSLQSHRHSLRPCLWPELLVLPEVSPYCSITNVLSLFEKCRHITSPLFITAWGFMANQQRKNAQNHFQVHTSQCKWKTHQRADALKCWYGTMITMLCSFFPFSDWKAVVLEKSLLASLLKKSWFCSVILLNTQC